MKFERGGKENGGKEREWEEARATDIQTRKGDRERVGREGEGGKDGEGVK